MDPRWYQIVALSALLAWGLIGLEFGVSRPQVLLTLATALGVQALCTRLFRLPRIEFKSALISGLSLCLLLRTNALMFAAVAAGFAVSSKFLLRRNNKHIFNPTNFAIAILLLLTGHVWVSPGQWGSATWFGFAIACVGSLVVTRARRADVTLAFLAAYAAILCGRSLWLGQPMAVPLHRLQNGALLLFAFFMISDPKTTPDSRSGRIAFALLVAAGAGFVQFVLFRTNGLLWSLAVCSPVVPWLDRWLPGARYAWKGGGLAPAAPVDGGIMDSKQSIAIRSVTGTATSATARATVARRWRVATMLVASTLVLVPTHVAWGFCGFYVAKADAKLFNKASKVVLVRDGDRTVLTMASDYKGEARDFAMVVPVPVVLEREQIHVAAPGLVEHVDAFTAPRLVEYFDPDPCTMAKMQEVGLPPGAMGMAKPRAAASMDAASGVTIEARYTVGEYDILILSARDSHGLEAWLIQNGYRIPPRASQVLASYIKQDMKFFVARVNLTQQAALGYATLRPLQMAYESRKFMLPIRLGMVNADGPQELFVYTLTRKGRVETTNYRTVQLPTGMDLPPYLKSGFETFYRAMFAEQVRKEDMRAVFLEHAWDTGWCDPCACDPLSADELRQLGVMWQDENRGPAWNRGGPSPTNAFVTRLHVRYDAQHFPEDLVFQETADRDNFQGRFVLRHPWTGGGDCEAAIQYRDALPTRQLEEVRTLAQLTGWNEAQIRGYAGIQAGGGADPWWRKLWGE